MIKEESDCVDCQLPCIYEACPYYRVKRRYCDKCDNLADYKIDGDDYCESCAWNYMEEMLDEIGLEDVLDLLEVDWERVE